MLVQNGFSEGDALAKKEQKSNDSTNQDQRAAVSGHEESMGSPGPRLFAGTSRYGRHIKPKSLTSCILDFPKSSPKPKNIKLKEADSTKEDNKMDESVSVVDSSLNSSADSSKIESDKIDIEELKAKCPWTLGQVVWARFGTYPFWPSVVTLDPETKQYVTQRGNNNTKYNYWQVHVRFCADKGRHNWISFANILPFAGLADFEQRGRDITFEIKKKEPRFANAFVVKPSIKLQWDDAVAEATRLTTKTVEERNELFHPDNKRKRFINKMNDVCKKDSIHKNSIDDNIKKRKKSNNDTPNAKKLKHNINESENSVNNKIPLGNSISLDTPPTPPSSHKDSSDEAPIIKKIRNRKKSLKEGVFEIFCERNRETAEQLDPTASESDIKAYLQEMWELTNDHERAKYRADYLEDEELTMYGIELDEEDEDDIDSDKSIDQSLKTEGENEETTSIESDTPEKSARNRKSKSGHESWDRDDNLSVESLRKRKSKNDLDSEEETIVAEAEKRNRPCKIFKGMKIERVCQICEQPGKMVRCRGPCHSYFHPACVKPGESSPEPSEAGDLDNEEEAASCSNSAYKEDAREIKEKLRESREQQRKAEETAALKNTNFKCIDCLSGVPPPCFICGGREGKRVKCSSLACGKHYHEECLKAWPQSQWQGGRLNCPYHVCHSCASDNPQDGHARSANEKFARCIRCPSTYHPSVNCLPAGSKILTASQIICPKHYKPSQPPFNAAWCFLCTEGGSLICCDTCPMSFHVSCLSINKAPDGCFICEDCETGRLPLYGEVVWVKHGVYRWWPSVICYPHEIPANIAARPHKVGEFCVMFLGTRDYSWVHRGKVFLFQDDDASAKVIGTKRVEESYRKALREAKIYHEYQLYEKAAKKGRCNKSRQLKPPPYQKLKVNKPVGNVKMREADSIVACNCDPNKPNPCSPDSDCLNRILLIECSPEHCPAGTKCQNQMFVQRKYPNMEPFHTEERGWGLSTLDSLKEGQFVIEYVGEVIDEAEYRLRLEQKRERKNENYYFLTIDNSRMIDAEPKGNLSRFMNHSCAPNCETQKWTVNGDTRIGLFALRDINPGEELTFNYNLACDGETRKPCLCKAPNCSGFIGLKVPKQSQISIAQQKKIEKVKRQRKCKKVLTCWNCNIKIDNVDEAFKCDQKTCGKYYHPHCIAIEDGPDQIFHCPWHFCAECYKRTSIRCSYCCNAFCQNHTYGNLREHPENGMFICYNHPAELMDCQDTDIGEALMDDDGYDDVVITFDNYIDPVNASSPNAKGLSSEFVTSKTQAADESSPRGAIVEVQPSSEDGEDEENETERQPSAVDKSFGAEEMKQQEQQQQQQQQPRRRGRPSRAAIAAAAAAANKKTGTPAKEDFTLDQIAAIIGIVK